MLSYHQSPIWRKSDLRQEKDQSRSTKDRVAGFFCCLPKEALDPVYIDIPTQIQILFKPSLKAIWFQLCKLQLQVNSTALTNTNYSEIQICI